MYMFFIVESQDWNVVDRTDSQLDNKRVGEETAKRRKINSVKEDAEVSSPGDELFTALPCLVNFGPGVKIAAVAAGGRHTLALSGKSLMQKPPTCSRFADVI